MKDVTDTGEAVDVVYEAGGAAEKVTADICLVAVGRGPVTEGLGLEEAGVSLHEKGFVNVDGQLRTNVEHVWAVGDVAATPLQLAHVSFTEGYAVAERIAGETVPEIDYVEHPARHLLHAGDRERRPDRRASHRRGPSGGDRAGRLPGDREGEHARRGGFVKVVASRAAGPSWAST